MAVNYVSTRGENTGATYSSIVLKGLAADGGLFLPKAYPQVSARQLESWRSLSYADLAFEVLRLFADDIPPEDLKALCRKTYRKEVYCCGRRGEDFSRITPVKWLSGKYDGIGILELSNGPTLAFKDMAMQFLGALKQSSLLR